MAREEGTQDSRGTRRLVPESRALPGGGLSIPGPETGLSPPRPPLPEDRGRMRAGRALLLERVTVKIQGQHPRLLDPFTGGGPQDEHWRCFEMQGEEERAGDSAQARGCPCRGLAHKERPAAVLISWGPCPPAGEGRVRTGVGAPSLCGPPSDSLGDPSSFILSGTFSPRPWRLPLGSWAIFLWVQ